MKVAVQYQDQSVELELAESSLVAFWEAKEGVEGEACADLLAKALDSAVDYPALRQTVVPGDRVAIALGHEVPDPSRLVAEILKVLEASGVASDSVVVVAEPEVSDATASELAKLVTFKRHDPDDLESHAYLANTSTERRVYLNRELIEADFVVTLGTLGFDPRLGYGGPWSVLFPGLSNAETRSAFQAKLLQEVPRIDLPPGLLKESWEVSWLLGSQFQVGLVPGAAGIQGVLTGLGEAFNPRCLVETERAWGFRAESRAEMVVAGVGSRGVPTDVEAMAKGLTSASALVHRGGKIVLLSNAEGPLSRSVRRLIEAESSGKRGSQLKGLESEPDFAVASMIANAADWADVYLLSKLDPDDVEGLGMIPLEKPKEAVRLAALSGSCIVLSHAERVVVEVVEESR